MIRSRTAASRAPAAPPRGRCAPLDPPARSQNPAAIRDREQTQACPDHDDRDRINPTSNSCGHRRMQVRRISRGDCDPRSSRSATSLPERERTERRIGTHGIKIDHADVRTQIIPSVPRDAGGGRPCRAHLRLRLLSAGDVEGVTGRPHPGRGYQAICPSGRHQPSVVLAPAGTDRGACACCSCLHGDSARVPPGLHMRRASWRATARDHVVEGLPAGERSARRAALPCPEGEVPG